MKTAPKASQPDHATIVNDKGEVGIFIDRVPVRPDGYRLDGRFITILAGRSEIGSYELGDVTFGAATRRPKQNVTVFEMNDEGEVVEATEVKNVRPPAG